MNGSRSWLDRAVGACFMVLVGAAALFWAVRLLEAIWQALLVIGLVAGLLTAIVAIFRRALAAGNSAPPPPDRHCGIHKLS